MKKKRIFGGIAVILALAMVLCTCKKEAEEIECGWLTINNLPSVPSQNWYGEQVYWGGGVYFEEEITSQTQLHNWTFNGPIASFQNPDSSTYTGSTSPFPLMEDYQKGFLRSGTYLVEIFPRAGEQYRQYRAIMNVTFRNGSATIDYNDMTKRDSLPQY